RIRGVRLLRQIPPDHHQHPRAVLADHRLECGAVAASQTRHQCGLVGPVRCLAAHRPRVHGRPSSSTLATYSDAPRTFHPARRSRARAAHPSASAPSSPARSSVPALPSHALSNSVTPARSRRPSTRTTPPPCDVDLVSFSTPGPPGFNLRQGKPLANP